jgi:hypothetical protein
MEEDIIRILKEYVDSRLDIFISRISEQFSIPKTNLYDCVLEHSTNTTTKHTLSYKDEKISNNEVSTNQSDKKCCHVFTKGNFIGQQCQSKVLKNEMKCSRHRSKSVGNASSNAENKDVSTKIASDTVLQHKDNTNSFIENKLIHDLSKCDLTIEDSDSEDN